MIVFLRSRFSVNECFTASLWLVGGLALLVLLFFTIALIRPVNIEEIRKEVGKCPSPSIKAMLTGPLALKENRRSPLALSLEQKLIVLAQSMRPDIKSDEKVFCIGVNGSDQRRVAHEGEPLFIQIQEHPNGGVETLAFSETPTETSMIPHVLDSHSILMKVQRSSGEAIELFLQASEKMICGNEKIEGVAALKKAKWWGSDLLFRQYGGIEYKALGQKQKLEITDGNKTYVLFIAPKDFLTFREGKWEILESLEQADRSLPLAYVQAIQQNQLEIEAWDKDGFPLAYVKLSGEQGTPFRVVANSLISAPTLRSAKQISCQIEKKRMMIKEGDWLLKKKTGWHKLKHLDEIEAYLSHEQRGELLIVDQIDARGGLKGNCFNEMRTQMQPFSVPLTQVQKTERSAKGSQVLK